MTVIDERSDARFASLARLAFWTTVALYAALAVWLLVAGPPEVVGHFGANDGGPRFDPTPVFVGYMTLIVAVLVGIFVSVAPFARRIPIEFVNVPNRELWETPERRIILARRISADMYLMGAVTMLLMIAMVLASTLGGLGTTVPETFFVVMTTAYMVILGVIVLTMFRGDRYNPRALDDEPGFATP
ncbi:MAG: hypothetical protein ACXIUP_10045 [Microcella sp.]